MKVKNIMFFGFAAAILSAGAASAASTGTYDALTGRTPTASEKNIVTSKYYVDTGVKALRDDVNAIQIPDVSALESASHTHANGTNTTYTDNNGVISINVPGVESMDGAESTDIPTVRAVHNFVTDGLLTKQNKVTGHENEIATFDSTGQTQGSGKTVVTSLTENGANVPTDGAVYSAIRNDAVNTVVAGDNNGQIKVDGTNINVTGLQDAAYQTVATEIADSGTGLTTSDQVYDYVAGVQSTIEGQINALDSASHTHADGTHTTATEVNGVVTINVADSGTVTSGNDELVTGGTVYTAIQDQAVNTVVAGDNNGQIKVDGTNINVTGLQGAAYQTVATEIADSGTGLTTSDQVYDAINSATTYSVDGLACDDQHPCALVNENGTKVWRRMAI